MASTVQWRLMFRVANREVFDKCLARVLPRAWHGSRLQRGGPTGRRGSCGSAVCRSRSRAVQSQSRYGSPAGRKAVGIRMVVFGHISADSADGFSGVFATGHNGSVSQVPGLEWASFDVVAAGSAEPNAAPDPGPYRLSEFVAPSAASAGDLGRLPHEL